MSAGNQAGVSDTATAAQAWVQPGRTDGLTEEDIDIT